MLAKADGTGLSQTNGNDGQSPPRKARFSLADSRPSSTPSSRSSSPGPYGYDEKGSGSDYGTNLDSDDDLTPGRLARDVYEATLPKWRASVRRRLVAAVEVESKVIARMQVCSTRIFLSVVIYTFQKLIRTPWLDAYFVYTSSLGTHTFFMVMLPAFFFFGGNELGRGCVAIFTQPNCCLTSRRLLTVLALGVYCASVVKDLFCSPRPFAPPVTRLSALISISPVSYLLTLHAAIGLHHLEYGFPSTHSTNSVSIALFFFAQVYDLTYPPLSSSEAVFTPLVFSILSGILAIYAFSIVFGRLYTAMHSFTDCVMGVLLGGGIWWGYSNWSGVAVTISTSSFIYPLAELVQGAVAVDDNTATFFLFSGLGLGHSLETWVQTAGWQVPLTLIPICMLAVNQHPQPVDDCPCFEDAIAFASVVLGALVSRWGVSYFYERPHGFSSGRIRDVVLMPGSGWEKVLHEASPIGHYWQRLPQLTMTDAILWWGTAAAKMVIGVLIIFVWRIAAKSVLHLILPPIFRGLSKIFELPNRRFYTPATEYTRGRVPFRFLVRLLGGSSRGGAQGEKDPLVDVDQEMDSNGSPRGDRAPGRHALSDLGQAVPSVIDLPSTVHQFGEEVGGIGSGVRGVSRVHTQEGSRVTVRNGAKKETEWVRVSDGHLAEAHTVTGKDRGDVKHYDADGEYLECYQERWLTDCAQF